MNPVLLLVDSDGERRGATSHIREATDGLVGFEERNDLPELVLFIS